MRASVWNQHEIRLNVVLVFKLDVYVDRLNITVFFTPTQPSKGYCDGDFLDYVRKTILQANIGKKRTSII